MNQQLYNRKVKMPDTLKTHLEDSFNSVEANANTEGYNRNRQLRNSGVLTYQQLKRVKNWFDNFSGKEDEPSFILNGGTRMKNWTNYVLDHWRGTLKSGKKIKADTGMDNQYIDNHDKDGILATPGNKHEKGSKKFDTDVSESILKINKLIKTIQ